MPGMPFLAAHDRMGDVAVAAPCRRWSWPLVLAVMFTSAPYRSSVSTFAQAVTGK